MKTKSVVEFHIDDLENDKWFFYIDGEDVVNVTDENIETAAEKLNTSPELVSAIKDSLEFMAEDILSALTQDLEDIAKELSRKRNK